jgi:hypothetical protein
MVNALEISKKASQRFDKLQALTIAEVLSQADDY